MSKNSIQFHTLENEFSDKKNNRKTKIKSWLLLPVLLLLFPILAAAQAVSGVTGVVTDPNGALVPGVEVKLTDTKTGREQTTKANDDGSYTFNNVAPGSGYKLTFSTTGFQTLVITDVQLGIGKTETHNAQLVTGDVSGIVTVTTTTGDTTLNTADASIGNVIGERQLRELPIQLRGSPASLLSLQPGVVGNNVGISTNATADPKTDNRIGSVTGSRSDQGNITVDGIDANDVAGGFAFSTVAGAPIDSVQEFRTVSANANATDGRSSGGQVQIATKSGTNNFHGSLREFYRTEQTASNTFFNNRSGVKRPALRRHQYGGSLGGPLPFFNFGEDNDGLFNSGKDKLFFFFDMENRRDRSQNTASRTVPLQNFREGRIGYILQNSTTGAGACPANARQDTRPDCIGFLSQAQAAALDPRGIGINQAFLAFINSRYPVANDLTGGNGVNTGLFRFNAPVTVDNRVYTTRIDGNITKNQKMFGRVTITRGANTNALQQFPGDPDAISVLDRSYGFVVGHSWVVSSSLFNQITAGVTKQFNNFAAAPTPAAGLIDYGNALSFGGVLTNPFADISSQARSVYVPTFRDDVTWTKGNHTFQFGASFKPIRQNPTLTSDYTTPIFGLGGNLAGLSPAFRPGGIRTGSVTAYDTAYAFLLGRYASLTTNYVYDTNGNALPSGTGRSRSYAYNEYEFYAQDNWKLRSDLTINLGLRYQLYPSPYERNGFQTGNSVDIGQLLNTRIQNAANGVAGASAEPFLTYDLIGKANNGRSYYKTDKNNFGPRIGFAYNPSFKEGFLGKVFGDRKTSIHGGASVLYDRVSGAVSFYLDQSTYIFDSSNTRNFGAGSVTNSLLNDPRFTAANIIPTPAPAPSVIRPTTPFVTDGVGEGLALGNTFNYAVNQNFKTPYSYQFSLGVQRELPGNFLLDVSYVGRLGRSGFATGDASQTLNFKDAASGQFLFDAFNAVQSQVQSQLAAGIAAPKVTAQPWLENQITAAGNSCQKDFGTSCTQFAVDNLTNNFRVGDTSDILQQLYAAGFLRPNVGLSSQFAVNIYAGNYGKSNYNGMLVSLQKRFSKGFEFDINYTWSHSLDNTSSVANDAVGSIIFDLTNPNRGYGDSDFDIRHLFNANGDWDLPIGRGRWIGGNAPKWLDAIIGGWTVSGIVTARSGLNFSPLTGNVSFPVSFTVESPSIINGPASAFKVKIHDEAGGIQYFADPVAAQAALRYPRHGEIGGRNSLRGPSFYKIDALIAKKFKMPWSETQRLTIRAEAFNVTNVVQFNLPTANLNSTNFGRITTVTSGTGNGNRELQFGIRYDF